MKVLTTKTRCCILFGVAMLSLLLRSANTNTFYSRSIGSPGWSYYWNNCCDSGY